MFMYLVLCRIFESTLAVQDLLCRTEKDRTRLHDHTAGKICIKEYMMDMADNYIHVFTMHHIGILAGVRPCGIIVLLAELFRAESKSQVYANLHEFLRKHPHVSENIGKCKQFFYV